MARETTTSTLDVILLRVVERLKAAVAECTSANTYISTLPDEPAPNPAEYMFEVNCQSFQFESGHLAGAGEYALHTICMIGITIHSAVQLDQSGRDVVFLTDAARGVIRLITGVLTALSDHDLLDATGNQLLSHPLMPKQGSIPPKDDRRIGTVTIFFDCEFDWFVGAVAGTSP